MKKIRLLTTAVALAAAFAFVPAVYSQTGKIGGQGTAAESSAFTARYEKMYRSRDYEAYPKRETVSKKLKTSNYSLYDNPTGIYFDENEEAVLDVGNTRGEKLELIVRDFGPEGKESTYPLRYGTNKIKVTNKGLAYISYFTDNPKAPSVKVEISTGKVNGVFSSVLKRGEKRTPAWKERKEKEWKHMLENSVAGILDIQGERVALAYSVDALKKNCPDKGLELIDAYDHIIALEQQIMGLDKYKQRPKNRMFGRVIWNGFMHADGTGAAFHNDTMGGLANPDKVKEESWGIAHEFGHVNQIRPGLKWVSTGEVSNNIYSAWVNFNFNPSNMRLEHERTNGGDGDVIGGRFNAYLNSALVKGQNWLCQWGPDFRHKDVDGGEKREVHDHFVKLGPLWQLQLYFGVARLGNPDMYADISQIVRNTNETGMSDGRLALNFMKNVCDVQKQDLTDFFIKVGMLKPIDQILDDYSDALMKITEKDCQELVKYAKKYPKPVSPVIYYISSRSIDAYKNRTDVIGEFDKGLTEEDGKFRISGDVWKNVTVFETYKDNELIKIAMVGTDSMDNSSTLVMYPEGSTRIEAVAWNGKRTLVHGQRPAEEKK